MKRRNKRLYSRWLSILLSLCLLLAMTPTVSAQTNETTQTITATQIQEEIFALPDAVKEIEPNAQYIGRDKEAESLYTFVFKNQDGTRTMKLFDYPVKYQDQNGDLKDISTDIQALSDGTFRTKENAVITTFSKQLSNGISLEHEDVSVKLLPVITGNTSGQLTATDTATLAPSLSEDQKTVTYPYGKKTRLEYSLTYTGFKEDIVVQEYTGQTEYYFLLQTNGLTLQKIDESYFLTDSDGNIKATIGDIIIFTADEKNNTMGSMTHETLRENQLYGLTIHVDAEYLQDENTAYPFRIDPTVEINYDNEGAGAIEDATLNSDGVTTGGSGSIYVGNRSSYGLARVLMKFPALFDYADEIESYTQIVSAEVQIRDMLCQADAMTVNCHVFTGSEWSESSVNWSNANPNSYMTSALSSNSVSYANGAAKSNPHRYAFNITTAVRGWKNGAYNAEKGIIFKAPNSVENGTTYISKTFASYNRASYKPFLTVTYKASFAIWTDTNYVLVDQTKTINYSSNDPNITVSWSSSDTTVMRVTQAGIVTGRKQGAAQITATCTDSEGFSQIDSLWLVVLDDVGISDDSEYYIMNAQSSRFLSLETSTDVDLTNVITAQRSFSFSSQWKTEKQSDDTYQLISVLSPTGKCLDITNTNVDIYTDNNASYQKFSVCRAIGGDYQGLYTIRYGNYFVAQDNNYNVFLSTTCNANSYWSFILARDGGQAHLFTTRYTETLSDGSTKYFDTTEENSYFISTAQQLDFLPQVYINSTAQVAYESLKTGEFFIFNGHGDPGVIYFQNSVGVTTGVLGTSSSGAHEETDRRISDYADNALSNAQCVLYLGCSTGVDIGTHNLVTNTYEKGAHFVLGTTETVVIGESNLFLEGFLQAATQDVSIDECIDIALQRSYAYQHSDGTHRYYPIIYAGDVKQHLFY